MRILTSLVRLLFARAVSPDLCRSRTSRVRLRDLLALFAPKSIENRLMNSQVVTIKGLKTLVFFWQLREIAGSYLFGPKCCAFLLQLLRLLAIRVHKKRAVAWKSGCGGWPIFRSEFWLGQRRHCESSMVSRGAWLARLVFAEGFIGRRPFGGDP